MRLMSAHFIQRVMAGRAAIEWLVGAPMNSHDARFIENVGLIWMTIHRMRLPPSFVKSGDAFQYGAIGLLQAIKRFDPAKGEFSTIASLLIRWNVIEGANLMSRMNAERRATFKRNGRPVPKTCSIYNADGEISVSLLCRSPDPAIAVEIKDSADTILGRLRKSDGELLKMLHCQDMTLAEVGKMWGRSRQAISQKEQRLLKKLRKGVPVSPPSRGSHGQ